MLASGCFGMGAECRDFEPTAGASFAWEGDRDGLLQAFRDGGWSAELRDNSLTFDVRRAVGEHVFEGQVFTQGLSPAGNATLGLRVPGASAPTEAEAATLFSPVWPSFVDVEVGFVYPSSRHCGSI